MNTFTAIDFETAPGERSSICQVGLVRVENGRITKEISFLVQPPGNYYWDRFIDIHGISPEDTAHVPTFDKLWHLIEPFITNQQVVAHNGFSFDFNVLGKTLEYYGFYIMAKDLFNRYIWLVDTIYSHPEGVTLEEINEKWIRSNLSKGDPIPNKTFHNHRVAIEELFEINIECNKSTYRYYIDNAEDMEKGGVRRWLLNTFAVNNLINESHKLKQRILFEEIPSGQHYLTPIIEAMRDGVMLEMTYHSYWRDKAHTFSFEPYFVKVFKQRWYVIGKSDTVRIYALDRIQKLETLSKKFNMPKDPDPAAYFYNCFGIIHDEDVSPEEIKLKITWNQANYLRALPLHHSQKEIETTEVYSIFTYYVKPTFDFRQEILSLGEDAEVLSPISFRNELGKVVLKMSKYYQKDKS